ncbi:hypothetical protein H6G41_09715 [Tolypothrix sp. FACHB-123]|uniref:hypothetical protein n=1 Tax=Tolypothrix sp. FACHB-123 TaxID=2692868 RepID=UPI0016829675|nr:hypothetical protein [Tolypothrix sp. FACHB-123]MBD2354896.1 hypothetical protein [Tolypothrix sp. FACHB-123]
MVFQRIQRFYIVSLLLLLLLTVANGIFVYLVSPLRDPTFQPNSANAGSLLPWMKGVTETHWLWGANILAFALSSNITLITWQKWVVNKNHQWLRLMLLVLGWILLFSFLWMAFLTHLFSQWIVD